MFTKEQLIHMIVLFRDRVAERIMLLLRLEKGSPGQINVEYLKDLEARIVLTLAREYDMKYSDPSAAEILGVKSLESFGNKYG